jgi:hypothetical protein
MGYVLSGGEERMATALATLQAFVAHVRVGDHPRIQDEAGQPVTMAGLLAEASWRSREPAAQRQLIATLADYADIHLRPRGDAIPHVRPPDEYWHEAGWAWARDFEQPVSEALTDELNRRYTDARCDELRRAAEEVLPRYLALPTADSGQWGVWDIRAGEFKHVHYYEGVARAHAGALCARRPWTDAEHWEATDVAVERQLNRETARKRWARQSSASPPATMRERRPGHGRQP